MVLHRFTFVFALAFWAATSRAAGPEAPVLVDRCDVAEVNHFYDENGRLVFDQVIFYDWDDSKARFQVRAWRLLKTPSQWPLRDRRRGGYTSTWNDGDQLRQVFASSFRETWNQVDTEVLERQFLPRDQRRELARPKPPNPAARYPASGVLRGGQIPPH